jgi:hypothetical protein
MVISFRPNPKVMELLERLVRETGKTKTGIICEAIEVLAARAQAKPPKARDYFAEWAPTLGCMRGPRDLSTNKRKYIDKALEAKRVRNAR